MIIKMALWRPIPPEICAIPILTAALVAGGTDVAAAYSPGTIAAKAEPIIGMIRELADPVAYGVFLWACVRFIMHQAPEAKAMMKDCAWGYFMVQMAPTFMAMIRDVR